MLKNMQAQISKIQNDWQDILQEEICKEYFKRLDQFLIKENKYKTIFPPTEEIFNCLKLTPFEKIKLVILAQDPYHNYNQANGLAFAVNKNIAEPASLKNIFKEILCDTGKKTSSDKSLESWAKQGILLLNTVLTVEMNKPGSHQNRGWECFTDEIIKKISNKKKSIIFLIWGNKAKKKINLIDTKKHHILQSSHPSPLSSYRGFFGCQHFSKANNILAKNNQNLIKW
tara:strand:- start:10773 stop:11456 length:684 start_codon:yes stop_codon:yes gene_type:complete